MIGLKIKDKYELFKKDQDLLDFIKDKFGEDLYNWICDIRNLNG